MHAMCKISETVSEVNQIRTERHAHALEYLQLPWKPSWRQTVGEARHLMSLFSVFISSSHSPSLLYSICLYISLALSLLCLMSHISVSVCVFVHLVYGAKSNTSSLCMESFSVFVLHLLLLPLRHLLLPFLSSSSSLFIRLKQCNSRSPDATSCKLSGSPHWRTLSCTWIRNRKQFDWSY